ncbi:hypothetical protein A3715_13980 [Oleiphilus sp. HI0009]|nr:hypothetical protein A3715_13980 [Oleiphilus sp. HI0009]
MSKTHTLPLNALGIKISWNNFDYSDAVITSDVQDSKESMPLDQLAGTEGIMITVLNHFKSGVDICSEDYLEGLKDSYQDIKQGLNVQVKDEFENGYTSAMLEFKDILSKGGSIDDLDTMIAQGPYKDEVEVA